MSIIEKVVLRLGFLSRIRRLRQLYLDLQSIATQDGFVCVDLDALMVDLVLVLGGDEEMLKMILGNKASEIWKIYGV